MNKKIALIDSCPHCGNHYDFYTKDYIQGSTRYNYEFDGTQAYNGELFDYLGNISGKYAYCGKCDKRLFKMSEP